MKSYSLSQALAAEAVGTFLLVLFGVGAVHVAVLTGSYSGLWQVAVVWATVIALVIYAFGSISGAHINPAITLAFAVHRDFPWRRVVPYIAMQLLGAIAAAWVLYGLNLSLIEHYEQSLSLVRGEAGSEQVAMIFGEYFPNPAMAAGAGWAAEQVSMWQAMLAEGLGTAVLAFCIARFTDKNNAGAPSAALVPWAIGLTVGILIMLIAPLTQGGFNPARDFGPRLVAWIVGWGDIAIPGPRGGFFTVYILSPIIGAILGMGAQRFFAVKE